MRALEEPVIINGRLIPFKDVQVNGRVFKVPVGITRVKADKTWHIRIVRNKTVMINEYFADGTYLSLPSHSLRHAIDRLIEFHHSLEV